MSKVVIVDGNNIAHAAYYAYRNLSYKGKPVGVMYGIISMIRGYIAEHSPDDMCIVWDSARHPKRLELLPEYKGSRVDKQAKKLFDRESFESQKKTSINILSHLGIRQFKIEGNEADDLIYHLVRKYHKKTNIVIISADKDFLQLLRLKSVSIWNPIKRVRINHTNCNKYFPVPCSQVVDYLCLTGDSSDNIPNYPKCGEKTAIGFLNKFGSISRFLDNTSLEYSKFDRKKLLELFLRNKELIDLRMFYNINLKGKIKTKFLPRDYDEPYFTSICGKYAFYSMNKPNYLTPFKKLYYEKTKTTVLKG